MIDENNIIRKVLRGDVNAFRYFVETYKDMAFSLAMGMLHDESAAEDSVQVAFINAFRNLKKFKKRSKFSTWFYTIVVNEARVQLRKRNNVLSLEDWHLHEAELYEENTVLRNLHRSDQKRIINRALGRLSSTENLLMRLFYQNENSIDEIRKITGFSSSKIKTGLHRARQNFNHALKNEYRGEVKTLSAFGE